MSIYNDMMLMESVINEGLEQEIQSAFQKPGIGEFIQREFQEATSPGELAMGLSGMAKELDADMKTGSLQVAREYGFQSQKDIIWFRTFVQNVVRNAQSYFKDTDALHESEESDIQAKIDDKEEQVQHAHGDEKDDIEREIVSLASVLSRLSDES